jgi:hypothetical protein
MIFRPHKHVISNDEIQVAEAIGVEFINCGSRPEILLNKHFPDFELLKFFSDLSDKLSPLCQSQDVVSIICAFSVELAMTIQLYTDNVQDELLGLGFSRIFSIIDDVLVVKHDFFRLPYEYRGKGIAKEIMKLCLQQYVNMNVQKIIVHAALSNGGYTWALYNFTIRQKAEVDTILEKARQIIQPFQFKIIKKIYDNYYNGNNGGSGFPIVKWAEISFMKQVLTGSSWHGEIDLNNQEQFNNFISYAIS